MPPKTVKLVSISEYARHYNIDRHTVYKLLEEGSLTRYEDAITGEPRLSLSEKPKGVKPYRNRPRYRK